MKKNKKRGAALLLSLLLLFGCFSGMLPEIKASGLDIGNVVIQEIYGGGGNSGATYKNDYIVLYNPTNSSVSLEGWSIQYTSSSSTTLFSGNTTLSGTIQAHKYYLIKEKAGAAGTTDLPTADITGVIDMSGSNGKVALVNSTAAISGKSDASVVDFVGFGTANAFEGTATAQGASNTKSISRLILGVDTNDNKSDFGAGIPSPKSSTYVDASTNETKTAAVTVTPQPGNVLAGQELILNCNTQDAVIYYQINGGSIYTYNTNAKPVLDSLPASVVAWATKADLNDGDKNTYQYTQSITSAVTASIGSGVAEIGSNIKLESATSNAEIKYSIDDGITWNVYTENIVINKLPYSIQAKATAVGHAESTVAKYNYISISQPQNTGAYNIYFGQLHSHTSLSDGAGTVEQAFEYASKIDNLDFFAVTDHSNSFETSSYTSSLAVSAMDNASWKAGKNAATAIIAQGIKNNDNKMDPNSSFIGIYGYEMTWSDGSGHINTFNTPGFENRNNPIFANKTQSSSNPSGLAAYYSKLAQVGDSISQFNHPSTTFGDFYDFANYNAQSDRSITLIEVGNGEGDIGSNGYFPSYGYYTRALDKGWHLAPTNNQDNHKGKWGDANTARSVILANSLTEDSLYDALKNYRVYASEDNDLSILYKLNGQIMGSILSENPEEVNIEADISDPTDSAIGKVEVIVNGGKVAASQTLTNNSDKVSFKLNNDYTYYYLRITEPDGNTAVTAPVWTGDVEKAGIASITSDTVLPVNGESINLTTNLYNNEAIDLTVESIEYNDGSVFKTIQGSELSGGAVVSTLSTKTLSFSYTPQKNGENIINVKMKAKVNGVEKIYTGLLQLSVSDPKTVTKVLIDGTHLNDYVSGYYSGNMTNFINICANDGVQARIETNTITKEMLDNTDLIVITAPLKYDKTGALSPSQFSAEFNSLISAYVNSGGTAIVCGTADYQDSTLGDPYTTTTQINHLLSAIGAKTTINSDEVYDPIMNAGQAYRLKFKTLNSSLQSKWLLGIDPAQEFSAYSGCTVNPDNENDWLVMGHSTTYSINSKKLSNSEYENAKAVNAKVIEDGKVCVLSTEKVGKGTLFVAGSIFMSNFEVQATMDNYSNLQYSNYNIINNILDSVKQTIEVTNIADIRKNGNTGDVFKIEGTVTAGSEGSNAFFDTIYVQDATGGIDIFPIANGSGIKVGQKIRVIGHVDSYQGDMELKIGYGIEGYTILDEAVNEVQPSKVTAAQAMDYALNGGNLVKVTGTVSDIRFLQLAWYIQIQKAYA